MLEEERLVDGGSGDDDPAGVGAGVEGGAAVGAGHQGVAVEPLQGGDDLGQGVGAGPAGGPDLALFQVSPEAAGQAVGVSGLGQLGLEGLGLGLLGPLEVGQRVGEHRLDRLRPDRRGGTGPVERRRHLDGRPPQTGPRSGQGPRPVEAAGGQAGGGGRRFRRDPVGHEGGGHVGVGQGGEIDPLAAGPDGRQQLVGRLRQQEEVRPGRRLLQRLQELVGRRLVHPVGLGEDDHLPLGLEGAGESLLHHVLDLVDDDEGPGRLDLDHVGVAGGAGPATGVAGAAAAIGTDEGGGEAPGGLEHPRPPGPGQVVGVVRPIHGPPQPVDRPLLPDDPVPHRCGG
ncbi:MAG TPA: hypothetical protein VHL53_21745 [Acidimicrobiia bacterium]|nr:hypothetical protein [Acidimicrobiia bacterium]